VRGAIVICVVDTVGDVGSWVSLDVDAQGSVHIAYFSTNYARHVLKYATTSPGVAVAPRSWSTVKSAFR
jgi:predicted RNA-binding protein with RPS1 domain